VDSYPDADVAGMYGHEEHADPACAKSRIGFIIILQILLSFGNPSYRETALSTMEAKIIALSACCRELFQWTWLVQGQSLSNFLSGKQP
jgi:hypothetical protein